MKYQWVTSAKEYLPSPPPIESLLSHVGPQCQRQGRLAPRTLVSSDILQCTSHEKIINGTVIANIFVAFTHVQALF